LQDPGDVFGRNLGAAAGRWVAHTASEPQRPAWCTGASAGAVLARVGVRSA